MTTNQTIDGVPREWLEEYEALADLSSGTAQMLRALLDAPAKEQQWVSVEAFNRVSTELEELKAAQPQGEPVAWMFKYLSHSDSPPHRSFEVTDFHQNPKAPGIAQHTPLYAEQPAPVAVETCTWSSLGFSWSSTCGMDGWEFTDGGTPAENGMKFCHCCGKSIATEVQGDE